MFFTFLKKTKVSSRILFVLWIVFSIALPHMETGNNIAINELYASSFPAMAIIFLVPAIWIECKTNIIIKGASFGKLALGLWLITLGIGFIAAMLLGSMPIVAKLCTILLGCVIILGGFKLVKKQVFSRIVSQTNYNDLTKETINRENHRENIPQENDSFNKLREIEKSNKESVYQLIKENCREDFSQEKNSFDKLKEIEKSNKESVYQLIKENSYKAEQRIENGKVKRKYATTSDKNINNTETKEDESINSAKKTTKIVNIKEELLTIIDEMEGHKFEFLCADLLKRNGFENVEVTPGSNDQGADIIAEKDELRYAIQCKRVNNRLNNKPLQEVALGKAHYHCILGAVLTNNYFNENAKVASNSSGILLWDRDKLVQLIDGANLTERDLEYYKN